MQRGLTVASKNKKEEKHISDVLFSLERLSPIA